ncbi:hypothetical protein D3C78_894730 [compost metagenome]
MPLHDFAGDGVSQLQHGGVQRLAVEVAQGQGQLRSRISQQAQTATVSGIPHQRMLDVSHVDTDLVGTTGFQTQTQTGVATELLVHPVVGHGRTAIGHHSHVGTLGRVTADGGIHGTACGHVTYGDGFVLTGDLTRLQRLHQMGLGRDRLGNHHQASGVFIQTVHYAGTGHLGDAGVAVQQGVQYGAVRRAGARVDHQTGRLVDHQNVFIFIDDVEVDVLGIPAGVIFQLDIYMYLLPGHHFLARGIGNLTVQGHSVL